MRYRVRGGQHRASRHLPHATGNDSELVITGEVPGARDGGQKAAQNRHVEITGGRQPLLERSRWSWGIATGAAACALLGGMPAATP